MHCNDCSQPIEHCECSPFGGRRRLFIGVDPADGEDHAATVVMRDNGDGTATIIDIEVKDGREPSA